jgi:hypothetical protein
MNRNSNNYVINDSRTSKKNINYKRNNLIHENYWFQDLNNTIFNMDYALKIFPESTMTYSEKINSLVRLSLYIGLILGLFYANYLYLYIPITTMALTYLLYTFRLDQLENNREKQGPTTTLNDIPNTSLSNLKKRNISSLYSSGNINTMEDENFKDILNIKTCSNPNTNNPFMNPLVYDSRTRDRACDSVKPETQEQIEYEYNKYCIKDISDIYNHNSGRRQFYTVASTTYPNNQGAFANWLYKTPPTCKEGNGAQCIANYYTPLNGSLATPGYGSKP